MNRSVACLWTLVFSLTLIASFHDSGQFNVRFSGGSSSAHPAQPALDSAGNPNCLSSFSCRSALSDGSYGFHQCLATDSLPIHRVRCARTTQVVVSWTEGEEKTEWEVGDLSDFSSFGLISSTVFSICGFCVVALSTAGLVMVHLRFLIIYEMRRAVFEFDNPFPIFDFGTCPDIGEKSTAPL